MKATASVREESEDNAIRVVSVVVVRVAAVVDITEVSGRIGRPQPPIVGRTYSA